MIKKWRSVLIILTALICQNSLAARTQTAFGFGPVFFSGPTTGAFTPSYAFQLSYNANKKLSKVIYLVNRFDFALFNGEDFASAGTYNGLNGTYTLGPRINFAKEGMVPYFEASPTIGMFAVVLGSPPASVSKNQTALKYGYIVGMGFDSLKGDNDSGGWGINVSYFQFLKTIPQYEFTVKPLTASGVKVDIRFILPTTR